MLHFGFWGCTIPSANFKSWKECEEQAYEWNFWRLRLQGLKWRFSVRGYFCQYIQMLERSARMARTSWAQIIQDSCVLACWSLHLLFRYLSTSRGDSLHLHRVTLLPGFPSFLIWMLDTLAIRAGVRDRACITASFYLSLKAFSKVSVQENVEEGSVYACLQGWLVCTHLHIRYRRRCTLRVEGWTCIVDLQAPLAKQQVSQEGIIPMSISWCRFLQSDRTIDAHIYSASGDTLIGMKPRFVRATCAVSWFR